MSPLHHRLHRRLRPAAPRRQRGATSVEFALVAVFGVLPLLLGISEFGRLFYLTNTAQEITRRAAREQVVNWLGESARIQRLAVFQPAGGTAPAALPAGPEFTSSTVKLSFHQSYDDARLNRNPISGGTPQDNLANCLNNNASCIRFVRASLLGSDGQPVRYRPMTAWFGDLFRLPLPGATVIMPAESLGLG